MDVGTVQNPVNATSGSGPKAGTPVATAEVKTYTPPQNVLAVQAQEIKAKSGAEQEPDKEKKVVEDTVKSMNGLMELMTADLRFSIHQKTNRLMVQLVSEKDQKVLREYPSKEFLDMIANIREFVGVLTDKKA